MKFPWILFAVVMALLFAVVLNPPRGAGYKPYNTELKHAR